MNTRTAYLGTMIGLSLTPWSAAADSNVPAEIIEIHPDTASREPETPDVDETLSRLWSKDREVRLETALAAGDDLADLDDPELYTPGEVDRVVASLRGLFAAHDDEWFLDRLAASLAETNEDPLDGLFRELLDHSSPNVRWRAIEYQLLAGDPGATPALEKLWKAKLPPWVRINLMEALALHGSSEFVPDLEGLAESEDADLAASALERLERLTSPRALGILLRHAEHGRPETRVAATRALGGFPESREALEALLAQSRDPHPGIQEAAVDALSRFEGPVAESRLMSFVREPDRSWDARMRLFYRFYTAETPLAKEFIQALREEPPHSDDPMLQVLSYIFLHDGEEGQKEAIRARATARPPQEPRFVVQPADGARTTRCWRGPDWAGDPAEHPRVFHGERAEIVNRFEGEDGEWVKLDRTECWVPRGLMEDSTSVTGSPAGPVDAWEIDLVRGDVERGFGRALAEAGLLRVFDTTPSVVAVAIEVDAASPDAVSRFLDLYETGQSLLHLAASFELGRLGSALPKAAPLLERIRNLERREPGEGHGCGLILVEEVR